MTSGADQVVIDLEDAVAAVDKDRARALLGAMEWHGLGDLPQIAVRVNAPRTRWCHLDIEAVAQSAIPAASIVLPKVESPGDLQFAERLLDGIEAGAAGVDRMAVEALIETADGLSRVDRIASAAPRLSTLIIGYADLAASLGRAAGLDAVYWIAVQDRVLTAARVNRLDAVDGPYLGVRADGDFEAAVNHAARSGFDAKWAIHPRQVEAIKTAFEPSPEQVQYARRVIDALSTARDSGSGAV
ncbi:HpcH/HpaI aldolase/citrate lyase family protein, partial [Nocardia vaccinii]|uniref:HpcH/HpaI aldolase/citrate lyase family protein n=1 Tax=Nocardia vaccinii TaxID=1822 RepID=UPI00082CF51B